MWPARPSVIRERVSSRARLAAINGVGPLAGLGWPPPSLAAGFGLTRASLQLADGVKRGERGAMDKQRWPEADNARPPVYHLKVGIPQC